MMGSKRDDDCFLNDAISSRFFFLFIIWAESEIDN